MGQNNLYKLALAAILAVTMSPANALDNPANLSFDGVLDDGAGNPLSGPVALRIQIYNPAADCLLWEEDHASVALDAAGAFTIKVGTGTRASSAVDGGVAWKNVFANTNGAVRAGGTNCGSGYTPASTHSRKLRVTVNGSTTLSPDFTLTSVPFATVADTVQGLGPSDLVHTGGGSAVNGFIKMNQMAAVRFADSGGSNYVGVRAPAGVTTYDFVLPVNAGTSGQVLRTDGSGNLSWGAANASQLQGGSVSVAAPSNGQVLTWNGSTSTWTPTTPVVSSNATQLQGRTVSAAVPSNGQVLTWNGSNWAPMTVSGSGGGSGDAVSIQGRAVSAAAPSNNDILKFNTSSNSWQLGPDISGGGSQWTNNASDIYFNSGRVGIGVASPLAALDIMGSGNTSAVIVPRESTANRPTGVNGMIRYNTTLSKLETFENGTWQNLIQAGGAGTVSSVYAGVGLLGGTITTSGSLSVDVGTSPFKIVQLDGSGRVPAVDGSLLTFVNATSIAGRTVAGNTPGVGQVLTWNGSQWQAMTVAGSGGGSGDFMADGTVPMTGSLQMSANTNLKMGSYTNAAETGFTGGLSGPDEGRIWFNSDANVFKFWDGTTTQTVGGGGGDNMGNHVATTNIQLGAYWLSGDGGGEGIRVDAAGNVGIATTAPGGLFHTYGATPLNIFESNSGPVTLQLTSTTGITNLKMGSSGFQVDQGADLTYEMTISGGRIGLGGIPTAGAILDVNGTGTISSMIVPRGTTAQRPAGVNGMIRYNTNLSKFETYENNQWVGMGASFPLQGPNGTAAGPVYSFSASTTTGIFSPGTGNIGFATAGAERMRVTNAGFVGLGTTTPAKPLHIYHPTDFTPLMISNNDPSSVGLGFQDQAGFIQAFIDMATSSGDLAFDSGGDANYELMIMDAGPVGIHTAAPNFSVALDVGSIGTNSAILVPRATTANRPPTGANGMIRYNTTTQKFEGYENAKWVDFREPAHVKEAPIWTNTGAGIAIPDPKLGVRRYIMNANSTITLPMYTAPAGTVYELWVWVKQDGTGARTLSFAGNGGDTIVWKGGSFTAPATPANSVTIYKFLKSADETIWYGSNEWL